MQTPDGLMANNVKKKKIRSENAVRMSTDIKNSFNGVFIQQKTCQWNEFWSPVQKENTSFCILSPDTFSFKGSMKITYKLKLTPVGHQLPASLPLK